MTRNFPLKLNRSRAPQAQLADKQWRKVLCWEKGWFFNCETWQQSVIKDVSVPNNAGTVFQLLSKIALQHIIVLCLIGQACCQLGHTIINKPDSRKDATFLPAGPTFQAIKYTS